MLVYNKDRENTNETGGQQNENSQSNIAAGFKNWAMEHR